MSKSGKGRGRKQKIATEVGHASVLSTNLNDRNNQQPCPDEVGLKEQCKNLSLKEQNATADNSNGKVSQPTEKPAANSLLSFQTSKSTRSRLAKRPNFGTAGRPIELVTNYFALQYKAVTVCHYDVEINSLDQIKKYGKPVKPRTKAEAVSAQMTRIEHELDRNIGKLKCKEIFDNFVKSQGLKKFNPVYDGGKNIFTSAPLPFHSKQSFTITLEMAGKERKYEVIIQPVRKDNGTNIIDLDQLWQIYDGENEAIMAFNTIMNHREMPCSQVHLGRSFFYLNQGKKLSLGEGLEIWFGYNQSIHLTQKGPALVLNLAAKAFHKPGPVIDYINDILGRDITRGEPLKHYELSKIEECLKGVRVEVTHLRYARKYIVQSVSKLSALDMKLSYEGKDISIAQYYQIKYRKLMFPELNCLFMRSSNNQTYIPFENCRVIDGQPKLGKLNSQLAAKMIKQTAIVPVERFQAISQSAKDVQKESGEKMKSYSLLMDLQPMQIKGRVIAAPSLAYCNSTVTNPDNRGIWRMDGKNLFRSFIDVNSWILLCFSERLSLDMLKKFADTFSQTGKKVGLNFGRLIDIRKFGKRDPSEKVLNEAEKTGASFALIILSRRDSYHNYDEIKFIADYKLGFLTQCMEDKVLDRFNDQIAINVCLKVNTKLGGINHILLTRPKVLSKPVIIFGADAIHSPRGSGCPSIAAVVGSLDAYPSRYKVACRVQENPDGNKISQEVILKIREMVQSILTAFYHNTKGKHPEKIIFFRDGVSEGQFEAVKDQEVSEVQKASYDVIGQVVPITFIIVQKRHQTRFRPKYAKDGVGRGGNVPPGMIVDDEITHPEHFDYYLNSHEGIQGTSKPAHYTVLHDDNQFNADELQQLSYHLCYMYGKCNRSISIPAPVMYADLACYRAKKYADFHMQKEGSSSSNSTSLYRLPDYVRDAIDKMGEYKNNMFYV